MSSRRSSFQQQKLWAQMICKCNACSCICCCCVPDSAGACVATPCTNTTCRVGYCAGAEFCNYTSVNEGQLCTPPVSRRALKRTVRIMRAIMDPPTFPPNYPSTCQSGTCASEHQQAGLNLWQLQYAGAAMSTRICRVMS